MLSASAISSGIIFGLESLTAREDIVTYRAERSERTVLSGYFLMALIMAIRAAFRSVFLSPSISRIMFDTVSKNTL